MIQDARQWLNRGKIEEKKQPRTGATALHVAAAKGYSEVIRYLSFSLLAVLHLGHLSNLSVIEKAKLTVFLQVFG